MGNSKSSIKKRGKELLEGMLIILYSGYKIEILYISL